MNDGTKSVFEPMERSFSYQSVFQNAMVGQALISKNLNLIAANNRIFEYFQLKPCEIRESLFGCTFHCVNHEPDNVCSQNAKCKGCRIRSAVEDVLQSHISIKDSITQYAFRCGDRRRVKWFQMSGVEIPKTPYVLLTFSDITELKLQEDQLRKRLALDLATGTMNKYSLMESIQKMIEPEATGDGFTVCMIDFDDFKEINDQYGHLMGDKVLKSFSDIARRHIRKKDILGRYGGEEFIFIFPDTDQRQALRILKRIHKDLLIFFSKDLALPVTFSAGIIYVDQKKSKIQLCSDLIGNVDRMLYRAKKQGRNRVVYDQGEILFNASDR